MSLPASILFVADDPSVTDALRSTLAREAGVRVLTCRGGAAGIETAQRVRPDLVVLGGPEIDPRDFETAKRLRGEAGLAYATLVLITPPDAVEVRKAALHDGFDVFLDHPVEPGDLLPLVQFQQRLRRAYDQLETAQTEIERLRGTCSRNLAEVVGLLGVVADMGHPGAAERSRHIGELARRLAVRFDVPKPRLWDLAVAAQVHEVGWLLGPAGGDGWQREVCAATLLARVKGLEEAASLLRALRENWDGTGFPDHLQQGQVPLRSRILRVAIDYRAELDRQPMAKPEQALARLAEHEGTLYDPMVLVHFRAMLTDRWQAGPRMDRVVVPIDELQVGMVLAEDLCTDAGLKLLARGTRLTPSQLQAILRRHMVEPLMQGATIVHRAA